MRRIFAWGYWARGNRTQLPSSACAAATQDAPGSTLSIATRMPCQFSSGRPGAGWLTSAPSGRISPSTLRTNTLPQHRGLHKRGVPEGGEAAQRQVQGLDGGIRPIGEEQHLRHEGAQWPKTPPEILVSGGFIGCGRLTAAASHACSAGRTPTRTARCPSGRSTWRCAG